MLANDQIRYATAMNTSRLTILSLLVFTALSFVYYVSYIKTTINFSPTINYSINGVLDALPTCESGDRSNQENLLRLFHAWTRFAHEHRLRYCISDGSLVGYVQRGGLLPHDADLDVYMLPSDTKRLASFANANFTSRYILKVHPQWHVVGYLNRSYFSAQGFPFVGPNARFKDAIDGGHVDIWPAYDFHPDQPTNSSYLKKTVTVYDAYYNWLSLPNEWMLPFQPCFFSDIQTWCPANPKEVVAALHGIVALNHSNRACVNNTWTYAKMPILS